MFRSHKVHYKINITGYKLRVFYTDIVRQLDFLSQKSWQFLLNYTFFLSELSISDVY